MGFTNMTPIQEKSIPLLLAGEGVMGAARTGSEKTLAFHYQAATSAQIQSSQCKLEIIGSRGSLPLYELESQETGLISTQWSHFDPMCPNHLLATDTNRQALLTAGSSILIFASLATNSFFLLTDLLATISALCSP
ncbi:hypothetical protein M422DRAFT_253348 [Sphaerobolus stellatus SS14]|uniref:DEAD/DEAH-box helicase domain-containing protein n=1 Tax=Sphaerobolus stellatus (strain SS14) TaxID=990650 RepID=A0A0C9UKA3_SPHS4|nr:hypothetical protein M422DRAFT_253348 [Sphaerobolus stellatus SS14]